MFRSVTVDLRRNWEAQNRVETRVIVTAGGAVSSSRRHVTPGKVRRVELRRRRGRQQRRSRTCPVRLAGERLRSNDRAGQGSGVEDAPRAQRYLGETQRAKSQEPKDGLLIIRARTIGARHCTFRKPRAQIFGRLAVRARISGSHSSARGCLSRQPPGSQYLARKRTMSLSVRTSK